MAPLGTPNPAGDPSGHGLAALSVAISRTLRGCAWQEKEAPTEEAGQRRRMTRGVPEVIDADVREFWAQSQAAMEARVEREVLTSYEAVEGGHGGVSAAQHGAPCRM